MATSVHATVNEEFMLPRSVESLRPGHTDVDFLLAREMPPYVSTTITAARNNRLKLLDSKAWLDKGGPLDISTFMRAQACSCLRSTMLAGAPHRTQDRFFAVFECQCDPVRSARETLIQRIDEAGASHVHEQTSITRRALLYPALVTDDRSRARAVSFVVGIGEEVDIASLDDCVYHKKPKGAEVAGIIAASAYLLDKAVQATAVQRKRGADNHETALRVNRAFQWIKSRVAHTPPAAIQARRRARFTQRALISDRPGRATWQLRDAMSEGLHGVRMRYHLRVDDLTLSRCRHLWAALVSTWDLDEGLQRLGKGGRLYEWFFGNTIWGRHRHYRLAWRVQQAVFRRRYGKVSSTCDATIARLPSGGGGDIRDDEYEAICTAGALLRVRRAGDRRLRASMRRFNDENEFFRKRHKGRRDKTLERTLRRRAARSGPSSKSKGDQGGGTGDAQGGMAQGQR